MKNLTPEQIEALVNHDGLHCKAPFANQAQECQHYARYLEKMLWRYLSPTDWERVAELWGNIRLPPKIEIATQLLLKKHHYL